MSRKKDRRKKDKKGKKDGKRARREDAGCAQPGEPAAAAKDAAARECPGGKSCRRPKEHLCRIAKRRDVDALRELVRDAAYLCAKCGRAAAGAKSLCRPVPI